jgi:Arc/MetJ family transcription regulator
MSALGRIVLWCLKHGRTEALLAELPRWVGVFREVLQASTDAEALAAVMRYIRLRTQKEEPGQVEQVLGRLLGPQVREVYVTEGERLIQQGLEKGLEKGVERGRRGLLLHQLAQRFGPLPDWVHARLDSAPSDHIDRFAERVLTASTLDEVFEGA